MFKKQKFQLISSAYKVVLKETKLSKCATDNTDQSHVNVINAIWRSLFNDFLIKVFTLKSLFLVSIKSTQSNEICFTEN